jgi:hypothetical protein
MRELLRSVPSVDPQIDRAGDGSYSASFVGSLTPASDNNALLEGTSLVIVILIIVAPVAAAAKTAIACREAVLLLSVRTTALNERF